MFAVTCCAYASGVNNVVAVCAVVRWIHRTDVHLRSLLDCDVKCRASNARCVRDVCRASEEFEVGCKCEDLRADWLAR